MEMFFQLSAAAAQKLFIPTLRSSSSVLSVSNPDACEITPAVDDWCLRYASPESSHDKAKLIRSRFGLLGSLYFPKGEMHRVVPASKFVAWTFLVDDKVDETNEAPEMIKEFGNVWVGVMRGGDVLRQTESPKISMFSNLWQDIASAASRGQKDRLCTSVSDAFGAFSIHAKWLQRKSIPSVADYLWLRRGTAGVLPFIVTMEFTLGIDLQGNPASKSPEVENIEKIAIDHMMLTNDLFSFRKELKSGDYLNIVPVVAYNYKCNLQDAIFITCEMIQNAEDGYVKARKIIQESSTLAEVPGLMDYINGLGCMMMGTREWCLQSARYNSTVCVAPSNTTVDIRL